jgi:hypothetical protein
MRDDPAEPRYVPFIPWTYAQLLQLLEAKVSALDLTHLNSQSVGELLSDVPTKKLLFKCIRALDLSGTGTLKSGDASLLLNLFNEQLPNQHYLRSVGLTFHAFVPHFLVQILCDNVKTSCAEQIDMDFTSTPLQFGVVELSLASVAKLGRLTLRESGLKLDELRSICTIFSGSQTLFDLDLGGNLRIADQGAAVLSDLLRTCHSIKRLSLDQTNITDQGLQSLSEALESQPSLVVLNLNRNKLTEEGIAVHLFPKISRNYIL